LQRSSRRWQRSRHTERSATRDRRADAAPVTVA
jgi:hypothetical protein